MATIEEKRIKLYTAARIPGADYWDVAPDEQTEETSAPRILEILQHRQA